MPQGGKVLKYIDPLVWHQENSLYYAYSLIHSFILIIEIITCLAGYKYYVSINYQFLFISMNDSMATLSQNTQYKHQKCNCEWDTITAFKLLTVRNGMFVPHPKFIWSLFPSVMEFAGGGFKNGISALIKKTTESSLLPSTMWGHSVKMAIYEPRCRTSPDTKSTSTLILDFPVARTVNNKSLLFKPHSL